MYQRSGTVPILFGTRIAVEVSYQIGTVLAYSDGDGKPDNMAGGLHSACQVCRRCGLLISDVADKRLRGEEFAVSA
jgi:hypothetical protein